MLPISDELLAAMLEGLPAVFYVETNERRPRPLYLSPNADAVLGPGAQRHLADPDLWWGRVHPDDVAPLAEGWDRAFTDRTPLSIEYRYQRPDGSYMWIRDNSAPVRGEDGVVQQWQGLLVDVTDEHMVIEEARGTEARYRSLIEHLPAFVYAITDEEDYTVMYGSPGSAEKLGYEAGSEAWLRMRWVDIVHPDDLDRVVATWRRSFETRQPFDERYRQVRADGGIIWTHDRAVLIEHGGQRSHWQGVVFDVTQEHEVRLELEASEARRRALIENLPAVVYEMAHDDDRRTLYISPEIEAMLGYSAQEWIDQPDIWTELLHPDDRERELAAHDLHSSTGEPWSREYRLIAADGRVVWVRDVARLVSEPAASAWQGVFVDITSQKLAEEAVHLVREELEHRVEARTTELEEANALLALEVGERRRAESEARRAEERYRRLVEDLPAVVYRWDVPDDVRTGSEYVSPGIEAMLGYAADEWRTEYVWRERLHPHDADRVFAAVSRSENTGEPFEMEYRYLAKDGRVVWVYDRATLLRRRMDGMPQTFQGVMIDITARRAAEDLAADAERRFRELLEQGPTLTFAYRVANPDVPTVEVEYVSPGVSDVLGYGPDEFVADPNSLLSVIHPDDLPGVAARRARVARTGEPWDERFRSLRSDGTIVWLRSRGRCIERDERGRPARFVGVITDETDEIERRRAVDEELHRIGEVVHASRAILWSMHAEAPGTASRYTYISPECLTLTGYSAEELVGEPRHFYRVIHPDDAARVRAKLEALDDDPLGTWQDEYRILHRDGSVRWFRGFGQRTTPMDAHPVVWHGVTFDVTHLHPVEEPVDRSTDRRADVTNA